MSQASWATKAYVTDQFRISLRRGPSTENKILKFLPSGYPLEILEAGEGWNLVRSINEERESIKGWVLSRYLIARLPWKSQTELLSVENTMLKTKLAQFESEFEKALKLQKDKYVKLKTVHDSSQKTIEMLTKENQGLKFSQRDRLFILGALVLFCGLISGLIFGRQKKRRLML